MSIRRVTDVRRGDVLDLLDGLRANVCNTWHYRNCVQVSVVVNGHAYRLEFPPRAYVQVLEVGEC